MSIVTGLIPLALSRIGDLRSDEAKEGALRALLRAVNEIPVPAEALADAFERMLSTSRGFAERAGGTRAFGDVCVAIAGSPLPLGARRELLDRALNLALACTDAAERIAAATVVLDARMDLRWGERSAEVLEELLRAADGLGDDQVRGRAVLEIVTSLAKAGETDRALAAAEGLPASGRRALALARVAFALEREGLEGEGAALVARALDEIRAAPASPDRGQALRAALAHAVATGMSLPGGSALSEGLDVADALGDGPAQEGALAGAIGALHGTALEGGALRAAIGRIDASIERVADVAVRVGLRSRLGVALAALGDIDASLATLRTLAGVAARLWAEPATGPGVALPNALPILEILGVLADGGGAPRDLERFAAAALDLLAPLDDHAGVATLLGGMTRFFASPALPYAARAALLDRALAMAQGIAANDARVEVVAHISNALSIAGATERGDALFAGLVSGVGAPRARPVRLSRAVALVRLGRTADARAEIAAAATTTDPFLPRRRRAGEGDGPLRLPQRHARRARTDGRRPPARGARAARGQPRRGHLPRPSPARDRPLVLARGHHRPGARHDRVPARSGAGARGPRRRGGDARPRVRPHGDARRSARGRHLRQPARERAHRAHPVRAAAGHGDEQALASRAPAKHPLSSGPAPLCDILGRSSSLARSARSPWRHRRAPEACPS